MPSSLTNQLRRWIALDLQLSPPTALYVIGFAKAHGVNVRTVHRDIAVFRMLGQKIVMQRLRRRHEIGQDFMRYARGTQPLFARNLPVK